MTELQALLTQLSELIEKEKRLAAKKTWDDITNNDTLIYNDFDKYYEDKHLNVNSNRRNKK